MPVATQSRITNRDLFALTLRYAMESDFVERYAKYKGERTPSLFGDDDKPTWITVGAVDHHGGHPVQIEKKTGKMITGHFAGMTLSEAFGPVGKKHAQDRKKTGIESNEKLPLFDQASKVFEESAKKPLRKSQWADSDKAREWEMSDEFQHVVDTTPRLKAMNKLVDEELENTIEKGDYPDFDEVPTGPLGKKLRQAVADEMVKRGMEVPEAAYKEFKMNKPSLKLMDKKPESNSPEKLDSSTKPIPFRDRNKFAADMLKAGKSKEEIESAMVARGVAISDARMHSSKAMGDQAQSVGEFAGAEKEEAKPQKDLSASDRDAWMKQQASDAIRHNKQGDESRAALKNLRQGKSGAWWDKLDGMNSEEILKAKEKLASNPPKHAGTSSVDYDERDARDDALRLALRIKEATKGSATIQSKIHPSEFAKWEKLLDEASTKKPESGIVMPSQTIPNDQAKAGDQLGLFGDAVKAKVPAFKPKLLDQPKQGGLFDTKGNPDQMDLFGDGVMPDDMVYKPEAKKEEPQAKAKEDSNSAFNMDSHVKLAADSIEQLRGGDVGRLLEQAPGEHMQAVADHIKAKRPDLANKVDDELSDIHDERGTSPVAKPAEAKPAFKPKILDQKKSDEVSKTDTLLTAEELANAEKTKPLNYGDAVKTPDGKVGVMSGAGGLGSDRVRVNAHDGTQGYYSRGELMPATKEDHPEHEVKTDEWGQTRIEPKSNTPASKQAEQAGDDKPTTAKPFEPQLLGKKAETSGTPNASSGMDTLLSEDERAENPKAEFNLPGGAGKAHVTNDMLNKPESLNQWHVSNAFKSVDKKQHEALQAHIAAARPDLAEHAKQTMDEHARMKDPLTPNSLGETKTEKPWDQMTKKEQRDHMDTRWADYHRATLKKGDTVRLAFNGNTISVERVNKNGITSTGGAKWDWNSISPDGDMKEAVEKLKAYEASPENWGKQVKSAQAKDMKEGAVSATGLSKILTPESMEAIKNAKHESLGHAVEQVAKLAPGADRSDIRKAIVDYRKSQGIESPKDQEKKDGITMTVNSETPHRDEIKHAFDHIVERNGGFYLRNPETGVLSDKGYEQIPSKNQAINKFINQQRAKATGSSYYGQDYERKFKRVNGDYRSWLKSHGVKESELTGVDVSKERKLATQKAIAGKTWGLDDYKEHLSKMDRGEVTPEQHKEAFSKFQENKEAIRAELGKMKKDDIEEWHHEEGYRRIPMRGGETKDAVIKSRMKDFARSFAVKPAEARWVSHLAEDDTPNRVAETTAEHLRDHADSWKAEKEQQTTRKKERESKLEDPKTAEDWMEKRRSVGGYLNLSPAEQAKHDDAYAAHRRAKYPFKPVVDREIKQLSGEGGKLDFTLSKNYHSKRGADIFTASPGARVDRDSYKEMESAAKKLGGWYYGPYKGTPGGFHFPTESAREQFTGLQKGSVDNPQASQEKSDKQRENQASRLQDLAESQRERAESILNAPRKDNTARRARMAAGVEGDARRDIAQAETLAQVAKHISDGKAVHLQHVKNRAQVAELDGQLRRAKWNAFAHLEKHDANYKALPYDKRESMQSDSAREEHIAHAEYPYPYIHKSEAISHAAKLASVPGLKAFAQSLKKMAEGIGSDGKDYGQIMGVRDLEKIKEALPKMRRHGSHEVKQIAGRFAEKLDSMKRLEGMDITNSTELKAALREYQGLKKEPAGSDPIKEAERKLKRQKIEGFFPTPQTLVRKMLDHADIEDGHDVLEPSAGIGSIMDAVKEQHPGANLHGIEKDFDVAELLKLKGHSHDRGDFLEHTKNYDRIVMNPPFEHRQDESHVKHAFGLLNPGGKMVAIMGAGAHTNERSAGFRDWLSTVGGKVYDTPEGSFNTDEAFRKTGVNTKMVVISKPTGEESSTKYSTSFVPILLERYSAPSKPFIDDGDLLYDPIQEQYTAALSCLVERYDWNSSQHPRDAIGRFTKTRELPSHPDLQRHHSLHMENQKPEMTLRLRDVGRGFRNLMANAGRKSEFNGGDHSEESIWENIDKTALRALLEKTNQADHASMKGDGPKFHELINANQLIPKMIAERLHGGSRFFDPTKLRGRWNEPNPKAEQAPAQQAPQAAPAAPPQAKSEPAQVPQSEPQSAPEPQPKASKPKRAPITSDDLPVGISKTMSNRLEKSIKALIGDNPEAVKEFKGVVIDAWKHLTQEVSDHNQAFRQIAGGLAPIELMNLIDSARKRTLDVSKKKNFDIMADTAQRGYPHIIGADAEEGLSRLLETGIRPLPKVTDPEVAERAVTLAGPDFFRQFEQGEPPEQDEPQTADDWNDQFSWAVARVMVERYRREAFPERYAGKDQMTFNWDEAAHPREPKGADASKGGEFTKKQSPAVKPKGATLKDGYVLQPRAKAGGERSDVDGKFYAGGKMMPVHGLFSGMEKPPAKEKRSEGTTPIAKEDQDKGPKQVRQRSAQDIEAERERMEEQRKWDILQAGPISDLFGWIGDRPNSKAFQRSPGHKLWAPFAEKLGTDGVEKLTKFMKEKTLAREPNPAYANNVEWQINNDQHFHTKKHIKAVPNSRLGEIWLGEFIPESSLDDKLELNDKLKELLGGKEKYSHNPTQAQREAGNYKMQHIRVHGLPISIETPKGKKRNPDWPSLAADYGYFKNTLGKDGDHIDVFVGPDKSSEMVFVIDQVGLNGKFDEHKVLLGFANQADAVATYRRCYTNGWKVGPVTAMTIAQFKNWLASGKHSRPIGKQVSRYSGFVPVLLERYAKDDDLGEGHWVTIGSDKDEGGKGHGGHAIFIGKEGEIKAGMGGKFNGKKISEAFSKNQLTSKEPTDKKDGSLMPKGVGQLVTPQVTLTPKGDSNSSSKIPKGVEMTTAKQLSEDDGFFKKDNSGREVIQWQVSNHFPIEVGDTVECEGRTVTVAAKGEPFVARGGKTKWAYLYTEIPVRNNSHDDDMKKLAAKFRSGQAIDEEQVVNLVEKGLLTESEAMNRDW